MGFLCSIQVVRSLQAFKWTENGTFLKRTILNVRAILDIAVLLQKASPASFPAGVSTRRSYWVLIFSALLLRASSAFFFRI